MRGNFRQPSLAHCQKQCIEDERCTSISYHHHRDKKHRWCRLNSSPVKVCHLRRAGNWMSKDIPNGYCRKTMKHLRQPSIGHCHQQCKKNKDCKSFSYHDHRDAKHRWCRLNNSPIKSRGSPCGLRRSGTWTTSAKKSGISAKLARNSPIVSHVNESPTSTIDWNMCTSLDSCSVSNPVNYSVSDLPCKQWNRTA